MVNHENLNWHYLVSCDVKEGENDTIILKIYCVVKISTDIVERGERVLLRTLQYGEELDDENLRNAARELEDALIKIILSVRNNDGVIIIGYSPDDLDDTEVERRLNSKPYSYVKQGIVLLKT